MRPRVLIVDDSLTVRMDIGEALEGAGFEAIPCVDLRTARQELQRGANLVVLDIVLPDGDGLDLLKEVKSTHPESSVPVLLLSSEAEVENRVRGMGAGADEYLGKPYDVGQVVARARALTLAAHDPADASLRRILVIDDSPTFRGRLQEWLESAGYHPLLAATGEEGLAMAAMERPDAVVVDGMLPGIDGATVIRRIKLDAALRRIPCLLLTAAEETGDELRSLEAGADAYVHKSDDLEVIRVRLAALLRSSDGPEALGSPSLLGPKRLLAVDDSATYLNELGSQLRQEGHDVVLARSGEEALKLLEAQTVDCILLDLAMPGLSGQETCRRIKQSPRWRDIPLVMLTAHDDRDTMIEGINAGADDYIAKSADFDVLRARLRAQLRRKHFEDENRRIREELVRRETEARFQRLIHSNIIGVILGDTVGNVNDANEAFLGMLGYSRSELDQGLLKANVLTPPEWHDRDRQALSQLRETGSAGAYEKELIRKDGGRLPIVMGMVLLEGTERSVGFVLDRTEQRAAEQKIRDYAAALELANQELESFSYSVAHDLRAPLRSIDGFSRALAESGVQGLDEKGVKYLGYIRESAQHMSHLIDDLLTLSKVTRSELNRERVDLSALARSTMERLLHGHAGRAVEVVIQPGLWIDADPRLMGIVLDNLLGNALKFTSRTEAARIELAAEADATGTTYVVRDNGAGFDMATAGKLFGVFQRLHKATEFEGTGVGLATVQRIVHRHGGRVWADAQVGRGAAFHITLGRERPT